MKKIIGIVFLIVLICLTIVPFTNLTIADPISFNVTAGDTDIPVEYGLYCADGFFTNKCKKGGRDEVSNSERVQVAPGSKIKINFEKNPDELQIIREDNNGNEEDRRSYLENDIYEIIVPEETGVYVYSIEAKWDDKNRSAFDYFSIQVK